MTLSKDPSERMHRMYWWTLEKLTCDKLISVEFQLWSMVSPSPLTKVGKSIRDLMRTASCVNQIEQPRTVE